MAATRSVGIISPKGEADKTLLYKYGLRRRERLSVFSDDTDFLSVDACELHSLPEEDLFLVLVARRERWTACLQNTFQGSKRNWIRVYVPTECTPVRSA